MASPCGGLLCVGRWWNILLEQITWRSHISLTRKGGFRWKKHAKACWQRIKKPNRSPTKWVRFGKEKQHHRSIRRSLRRLMTLWCCFDAAAGGIPFLRKSHGTVASTPDFESFQPLWLLWFFRIAFRLFCPPKTIAVSRYFGIHPWKKLDFSRGSNESQKWADFGSFVRIRVRNVRTMLEQHSIHRCLPPNKWQRCMLWKSMTLIGQKCRIFWLRNRCDCFAIAANEQHSIIWKAESCRAFIRGRKPGATKSGKKIWWLS